MTSYDGVDIIGWDYRVVKTTVEGEVRYGIHEAYYHDGATDPVMWSANPVEIYEYSPEKLRDAVREIVNAVENKGVVDGDRGPV